MDSWIGKMLAANPLGYASYSGAITFWMGVRQEIFRHAAVTTCNAAPTTATRGHIRPNNRPELGII
jgi:hypothetical protein